MKRILLSAALVAICLAACGRRGAGSGPERQHVAHRLLQQHGLGGYPVMTASTARIISFNWGYGSPSPAVPVDNFTARYDRRVLLRGNLHFRPWPTTRLR